ncbi:MAG TPA: patatin-like phospholipase family protein [Syntrophales bacterium]|nr:patatin-like phospholipase family protein [Syntrophales bacterium]HNS54300.1 patatin-like phospholipase family protein [Syntrophales bacterium]
MKPAKRIAAALLSIPLMLASCVVMPINSHVNLSADDAGVPPPAAASAAYIASTDVRHDVDWRCRNAWRGQPPERSIDKCREDAARRDPDFIGLALSGGGSRAAVFSAAVMFELQRHGILPQVDVISSASGGSVTAALYAASCDEGQDCPAAVNSGLRRTPWKESDVYPLLQQNFIDRWRINCWRPENIVRYATYFDRTDVMAATFAETLFGGTRDTQHSFLFRDLNPRRPYLILNATNNTDSVAVPEIFTFTGQDFGTLRSRLDLFPVAYGVTGSAAFPGAFHYVTLRDYRTQESKFVHLMDGGVQDNLGIETLWRILLRDSGARYRGVPVLVILADARPATRAKSAADPDPRHFLDYFVDFSNVKDTYSLLMVENQRLRDREFGKYVKSRPNGLYLRLGFDMLEDEHPELFAKVSSIPTNFKICEEQAESLRQAAGILVGKAVEKIRADAYWGGRFN